MINLLENYAKNTWKQKLIKQIKIDLKSEKVSFCFRTCFIFLYKPKKSNFYELKLPLLL